MKAAYDDAQLSASIQDCIRANPGILQSNMGKVLGVLGKDTSRVINTLTNLGLMQRTQAGKTYELRVAQ